MVKEVVNSGRIKLFIDTKEIVAIKCIATILEHDIYEYIIQVHLKYGDKIEFKCSPEELDNILNKLKGE